MSDLTTILAALIRKDAIKEGKLDFLVKRYAPKLKEYCVAAEAVPLLDENDATDGEKNKKENEKALDAKYKEIVKGVAAADPTDAQNKNDFTEWLLKQWLAMDGPHKSRWAEDASGFRELLSEFMEIRQTEIFKADPENKADLNQYPNLDALRTLVLKYSHSDTRYELPELSDTGATVLYKDKSIIVWQVTSAKDLVKLSSWPPNDQPAWCTKSEGTAATYLRTGPEYVGFKDGEPLFQIDPHDESGKPQFMDRHNKAMHSSKMMSAKIADVLVKVMTSGTLNPKAQEDLAYVMSVYKAPNLNDAETFEYLSEYVEVNGKEAKKDPRFLEIEQKYVRPRYEMFGPGELRQLTNRYGRVGEAVSGYLDVNKTVSRLIAKIDAAPSFSKFMALGPGGAESRTVDHIDSEEWGLVWRIDGVFKKVFAKFDQEFDFTPTFKQFKEAIKVDDPLKVAEYGERLITLLKEHFPASSLDGFTYKYMTDWGSERTGNYSPKMCVDPYIKVIEQQAKPFLLAGFEQRVRQIDENTEDSVDAADALKAALTFAINTVEDNTIKQKLNKAFNDALRTVAGGKLELELVPYTKVKDMQQFLLEKFPNDMKSYRHRYRNPSWSEDKLPGWARAAYDARKEQLVALRDEAREQKQKEQEGKEKRTRWSPKLDFETWQRTHGPDTPDPEERTIKFILNSPSYSTSTKAEFLRDMKKPYPEGEEFILQHARNGLGDWEIWQYMHKHHNRRWPELEQVYPACFRSEEYQDIAFKGQRIPAIEKEELDDVAPGSHLDSQFDYINKHLDGKRWPELERRVEQVFNAADWKNQFYRQRPDSLAKAIREYIAKYMDKKRWPAIEEKMFENEDEGLQYVFLVLPDAKQRIRKLMEQHHAEELAGGAEKQSSLHTTILARFRKELEKL